MLKLVLDVFPLKKSLIDVQNAPCFAPNSKTACFGVPIGLFEMFCELSLCTSAHFRFLSLGDHYMYCP